MWAKMDEVSAKYNMHVMVGEQPPDSFTCKQYAQRMNVVQSVAKSRLARLLERGEIEIAGYGPSNVHYYRPKH